MSRDARCRNCSTRLHSREEMWFLVQNQDGRWKSLIGTDPSTRTLATKQVRCLFCCDREQDRRDKAGGVRRRRK